MERTADNEKTGKQDAGRRQESRAATSRGAEWLWMLSEHMGLDSVAEYSLTDSTNFLPQTAASALIVKSHLTLFLVRVKLQSGCSSEVQRWGLLQLPLSAAHTTSAPGNRRTRRRLLLVHREEVWAPSRRGTDHSLCFQERALCPWGAAAS